MARPRWRAIAEDLRQKIEDKTYGPGAQLPNEIDLSEQYDAGRNTIREAVGWLVNRGLVHRRSGRGTFVVDHIDPFVTTFLSSPDVGLDEQVAYMSEVTERRRQPSVSQPRVEICQPDVRTTTMLALNAHDRVVSRHQKRYVDGKPWSMQTSIYPMSLVTERNAIRLLQPEVLAEGTVRYLTTLGIEQQGYQDLILSRQPNPEEINFFDLPSVGVSILEHRRLTFAQDHARTRLTVTVFPADRNIFMINIGDVPEEVAPGETSD